jgi:hypothetical protein
LGLGYVWNRPERQEERVNSLIEASEAIEHSGIVAVQPNRLSAEVLRRVMVRLLLSTDANSSFWRFRLQTAMRAANAGERDALFEPAKTRRRGQPFQLDELRAIAVCHVYYLLGKGLKKHVALERIANALA